MRQLLPLVLSFFMSLMMSNAHALETPAASAADADHPYQKDHEELTKLRQTTEKAINERNFDLLKPYLLQNDLTVITVDGQEFSSLDQFRDYWTKLFENKSYGLERIEVKPVADGPTAFLCDTVGICHGTSNDTYVFKSGETKIMPERWTAVCLKDAGVWKLSRIIFSANILDNPVLSAAKDDLQKFVLMGAGAGIVIGIIIGGIGASMMRKKA